MYMTYNVIEQLKYVHSARNINSQKEVAKFTLVTAYRNFNRNSTPV